LLDAGVRVVDLAADFRIARISAEWEKWYGMQHACPDWVNKAVYGLPELNRESIRDAARLIANPGCYPTAVQLGFMPLIEAGVLSIAPIWLRMLNPACPGRAAKAETHILFSEASDNFKAYGVARASAFA
jgi:N-acetyl-gamma-glutamyl-phosphate reductase